MTENDQDTEGAYILKKSLDEHFQIEGEDYRRQASLRHHLIDILFITICAVISPTFPRSVINN